MIKQLLNSVIAKYRDLSVSRRSIICLSLRLRQIIDLLATDKSRYFAQSRPIIVNYLEQILFEHKVIVVNDVQTDFGATLTIGVTLTILELDLNCSFSKASTCLGFVPWSSILFLLISIDYNSDNTLFKLSMGKYFQLFSFSLCKNLAEIGAFYIC